MERIPFTGFDAFLLTLEQQYSKHELEGNICRYVIDLEGELNKETLQELIDSSKLLETLNSIKAEKASTILTPFWKPIDTSHKLLVRTFESDELIPEEVSANRLTPSESLICFDLVKRSSGNTTLIFSWHHLLMDGFGAALLLKQVFKTEGDSINLSGKEQAKFSLNTFLQAAKAKFFIDRTSKSPITSLISRKKLSSGSGVIQVISFGEDEVKQIDQIALNAGAKFGRSAYYLACCCRSVKSILEMRGENVDNFWIPVPVDDRKKGSLGPIIGNRLSFLFYRIGKESMDSIQACVDSINQQMVKQISSRIPQAYNHLMNYMKWLPLRVYLYLVKRRSGNSIASFLFTVAAEHPKDLATISQQKVINALSLPANPCPPGLTFAFMKFQNSLHLMMLYHPEAISEEEIDFLAKHIQFELMGGKTNNEKV